jgi:hypothetical protein
MKKKFNLYCGLLIAAIVFGIGLTMFETGYRMYQGGKAGLEASRKERRMGVEKKPFESLQRFYRMTPVELMPKGDYLMEMNAGDSIVNLKTGEKMPMEIEMATVYPKDNGKRLKWMIGLSYVCFCLWVIFWIAFFKLIIAVNKGKLFEKSMETQFSWCGWCLMGIYLIGWIGELANHLMNLEMFEFANYNQTLGNNAPDSIYLYSAIGLLLIGQIFKIARQMKEEQELTI